MVPWAFSRPGDLNFDAFGCASSSRVLGSNRKAIVKRLGSSTRPDLSCGESADKSAVAAATAAAALVVPASGCWASTAGWRIEKVADSW